MVLPHSSIAGLEVWVFRQKEGCCLISKVPEQLNMVAQPKESSREPGALSK